MNAGRYGIVNILFGSSVKRLHRISEIVDPATIHVDIACDGHSDIAGCNGQLCGCDIVCVDVVGVNIACDVGFAGSDEIAYADVVSADIS